MLLWETLCMSYSDTQLCLILLFTPPVCTFYSFNFYYPSISLIPWNNNLIMFFSLTSIFSLVVDGVWGETLAGYSHVVRLFVFSSSVQNWILWKQTEWHAYKYGWLPCGRAAQTVWGLAPPFHSGTLSFQKRKNRRQIIVNRPSPFGHPVKRGFLYETVCAADKRWEIQRYSRAQLNSIM